MTVLISIIIGLAVMFLGPKLFVWDYNRRRKKEYPWEFEE